MFSNSWISKRHAEVWCVHSTPNFSLPWQRRRQYRSSGSGFIIDAKRRVILTNAHCIEWHTQVKVQRRGSDTKHLATRPICLKTRFFLVFFFLRTKKSRTMINDASWEGGSTCWFLCNKICSNYLMIIFFAAASMYACLYINHPRIMSQLWGEGGICRMGGGLCRFDRGERWILARHQGCTAQQEGAATWLKLF